MRMLSAALAVALMTGPVLAQTATSPPPPVTTPVSPPGDGSGVSPTAPNTTDSGSKSLGVQKQGGGKNDGTGL